MIKLASSGLAILALLAFAPAYADNHGDHGSVAVEAEVVAEEGVEAAVEEVVEDGAEGTIEDVAPEATEEVTEQPAE